MIAVTELQSLDSTTLAALAVQHTAIVEGIAAVTDQTHLINICNSAFEILVNAADTSELSFIKAMKVNFLAIAIGSGMNIAEMAKAADGIMKMIDAEIARRLENATP